MYVEMKHIEKNYGSFHASRDVSFGIDKGKLVALLGPSGSGKTTILRMLAGLENPNSGDIFIDGRRVNDIPAAKRGIGFVFQNYALFRYMTVFDNVAFGLEIQKRPKDEIRRRVLEMIDLVGLSGMEKRYPNQLSGGQRQRVLIAMALTRDPKLVIADEPTTALDVTVQKQVIDLLNKLQHELGFAMVFVSHDLALVAEVANSITVMYAGQVVEQGPVKEILTNPVHEYTRGLLGSVLSIEAGGDRLHQVPGSVPSPKDFPEGDRFRPRSSHPDKISNVRPMLKRVKGTDHYYAELPDSELKRVGIKPYLTGGAE